MCSLAYSPVLVIQYANMLSVGSIISIFVYRNLFIVLMYNSVMFFSVLVVCGVQHSCSQPGSVQHQQRGQQLLADLRRRELSGDDQCVCSDHCAM